MTRFHFQTKLVQSLFSENEEKPDSAVANIIQDQYLREEIHSASSDEYEDLEEDGVDDDETEPEVSPLGDSLQSTGEQRDYSLGTGIINYTVQRV